MLSSDEIARIISQELMYYFPGSSADFVVEGSQVTATIPENGVTRRFVITVRG